MDYVIGDIHGQIEMLESILSKINLGKEDKVFVVGDMIDRGKNSLEVVKRLLFLDKVMLLRGNHEQMMIDYYRSGNNDWLYKNEDEQVDNGGDATLKQINEKLDEQDTIQIVELFESLEYVCTYKDFILVHAGLNPLQPLNQQTAMDVLWIRDLFLNCPITTTDKTVIFGHTSTGTINGDDKFEVWVDPKTKKKIGIDCGAGHGIRLAALRLDDMQVFYSDDLIDSNQNNLKEILSK